jgi:hypothetical protein
MIAGSRSKSLLVVLRVKSGSRWGCGQNGGYHFDPCAIPNDFGP